MTVETPTEVRFEPPGPGSWDLDAVHFPRPVTRYWAEMHPAPFKRGFQEFTRYYGMLFDAIEYAYVDGFAYKTMRPVPEEQVPERLQRAEEVFERKLWRDQLRDWDETVKPASLRTHRELQAVDPEALSGAELAAHLTRCGDHHAEMIYQHMRFTGAAMLPVGDFLAHAVEWTGLPPSELLGLMRGAAPVSAGASDELQALVNAIGRDSAARELLDSDGDPGEILASLRSLPGETGAAASAYLDLVGYRLLDGFDIAERYALELPDVLLRALRVAVDQGAVLEGDADAAAKITQARERVPEAQRAQFDELLDEARLTYRIRDERGVFSDVWASGIMRRVVIAAGRRLAEAGRVHEPEHLVDASLGEMQSLVAGSDGPPADELAERFERRTARTARDAPRLLGPPPPPPPDPAGLPPAGARVMRATGTAIQLLFGSSEAAHEERTVRGLPASPGVYEGPARRVGNRDEFKRIKQGDVLVTASTTEAFNILLPLLGGIVTDAGGLLSHAAIVAREYGIPGVVGTRDGTVLIPDGARVRIDGGAGEVAVLQ